MPYRTITQSVFPSILEFMTLSLVAAYQFAVTMIDQTSWDRLIGSHGALFAMAVACLVLWNSGRIRERNEDRRRKEEAAARETQHAETLTLQKANSEQLLAITVEGIKANGRATVAIESVDRTLQYLTSELEKRPCQLRDLPKMPVESK